MPFDYFTIRALSKELKDRLKGGKITSARLSGEYDLWLEVDKRDWVLVSASPHLARMLISSERPGKGGSPPDWASQYLSGSFVKDVRPDRTDRIISIHLEKEDEVEGDIKSRLILELSGRNSNTIAIDESSGRIVGCVRRVTSTMSRIREILPGLPYSPPPPQDRLFPLDADHLQFKERLNSLSEDKLAHALSKTLTGLSRHVSEEICLKAGLESSMCLGQVGDQKIDSLWKSALELYSEWENPDSKDAFVILDRDGKPLDFSSVDLSFIEHSRKSRPLPISEAIETVFGHKVESERVNRLKVELRSTLDQKIKPLERRLELLKGDLQRAEEAEIPLKKGNILLSNIHKIPKRSESVELEDVYDPKGANISIDLDPRLSAVQNAQEYFKMYRKAKASRRIVYRRTEATKSQLSTLKNYRSILLSAQDLRKLEYLKDKLISEGLIKKKDDKKQKVRDPSKISPRRYVTSDGWTVLVGRSNKENDILTHKKASRDDIWLHARGYPGSHVILQKKIKSDEPSRRTLEEAGALAAFWSKAKGSKTVPVDYTLVKYVNKPKGGEPGFALIQREKTLFVAPRLIASAEDKKA